MNLRRLKKLSKRAAPYLPRIGDTRETFRAEAFENYTGLRITERKHYERGGSVHADLIREGEIKYPAKTGPGEPPRWIWMAPPSHPKKGTIMVGAMSGYEEPEWDEETAWEALRSWVIGQFWDYDPKTDEVRITRRFRHPGEIFAAADELLREKERATA